MSRRFWGSLALTVPLFLIAMLEMLPGNPGGGVLASRYIVWLRSCSPHRSFYGAVCLLSARVGVAGQPAPEHVLLVALGPERHTGTVFLAVLFPAMMPKVGNGHHGGHRYISRQRLSSHAGAHGASPRAQGSKRHI